jgi:hypothetical protein
MEGSRFQSLTRYSLIAYLLLLLLPSCGLPLSTGEIGQTPEAAFLQDLMNKLAARDYTALRAELAPEAQTANADEMLVKMAGFLPTGKPTKVEFVGWNVNYNSTLGRSASVAAQFTYDGNKWILATAQFRGDAGNYKVAGFNVQPLPKSLAELNAFSFAGRGFVHYAVIAAATAAFLVTVAALYACVRTKGLKRKWLWLLFIVFGLPTLSLNWTTGAITIDLIRLQLLSAAVSRTGLLGPWIVSVSLPVGAIIFLWKRRQLNVGGSRQEAAHP